MQYLDGQGQRLHFNSLSLAERPFYCCSQMKYTAFSCRSLRYIHSAVAIDFTFSCCYLRHWYSVGTCCVLPSHHHRVSTLLATLDPASSSGDWGLELIREVQDSADICCQALQSFATHCYQQPAIQSKTPAHWTFLCHQSPLRAIVLLYDVNESRRFHREGPKNFQCVSEADFYHRY